jgi:hypothetical protein
MSDELLSSPLFPSAQPRNIPQTEDIEGLSSGSASEYVEETDREEASTRKPLTRRNSTLSVNVTKQEAAGENSPSHSSVYAQGSDEEEDDREEEVPKRKKLVKTPKRRRTPASNAPISSKQTRSGVNANSWRSWTAADRAIATSLDQLTSQDLSLHLYNAHALKKRAEAAKIDENAPDKDERTWGLPKYWTAWPLSAEEVPRESEKAWEDMEDPWPSRMDSRDPRQSAEDIEDILIGIVHNTARQRFLIDYPPENTGQSVASLLPSSLSPTSSHSPSPSSSTSSSSSTLSDTRSLNPTPLTDDSLARSLLLPTIRHILTRLDTLLMGLHDTHQHSIRTHDESSGETDFEPASEAFDSRTQSNGRQKSTSARSKSQSRNLGTHEGKAKARADSNAGDSDSEGKHRSRSQPKKKARRSVSRHSRATSRQRTPLIHGLRDWSDVLGLAAMHGWDRNIIDKTAKRCATLFGEGMDFRIISGGKIQDVRYLPEGRGAEG